jgi:hypothetical protein
MNGELGMKVFLDDIRCLSDIYGNLYTDEEWITVKTTADVFELLRTGEVTHLSLDNDLGLKEPEGHTVVRWMIENNIWPSKEVYVHSANVVRARQMREDIQRYYYLDRRVKYT